MNENSIDDSAIYCFGTETNRSYSGISMESNNQILCDDCERGNLVLQCGVILQHRYRIVSLIGRGEFSLVWFAYDYLMQKNVAIKILRKREGCKFENVAPEIIVASYLSKFDDCVPQISQFYDFFFFEDHCCLVLEIASQNTLTFLDYFDDQYVKIPLRLVKKIIKDTLKGLTFMHEHGVIHADLKPENVFSDKILFPYTTFNEEDHRAQFNSLEDSPENVTFKIGDFGNSCFVDEGSYTLIQTRHYRAPEIILGMPFDTSTDIWSLGCMVYELVSGYILFDPTLNEDGDIEDRGENKTILDSIHLSMIEKIVGKVPRSWASRGLFYRNIFNQNESLKFITGQKLCSLEEMMVTRGVDRGTAKDVADFIRPMLAIIPRQRPTARELLTSKWLYYD